MENMFSSVRRSIAFRNPVDGDNGNGVGSGGMADKIGSCIRRSMAGFLPKPPYPRPLSKDTTLQIRWRKGELIGCGAYGRVYMGMNLDSGELLAVKQVSIATNNASKQKAQAHIRELEEEVKLLKDLSHKNIVRYLGTAREEDSLNILLEFVPGGSISSLLSKFGSFPEAVIRMYTKQLLKGLEYLHSHGIIHRDIKGANILVDNKGCIKLADFGASKQVVELANVSGAKSMKGTPYWMAPEVILQTGHSFSADIWSVGCTVIEMATGKPPWSQQYQEVAALFHIGTTKSHPPIPEHLSFEAKDFLLQCLQKEPNMRPAASELLKHSFVNGEYKDPHPIFRSPVMEHSTTLLPTSELYPKNSDTVGCSSIYPEKFSGTRPIWEESSCDDMCQIGDKDGLEIDGSAIHNSTGRLDPFKSFNPMSEPFDGWPSKFDESPTQGGMNLEDCSESVSGAAAISSGTAGKKGEADFTFPCGPPTCEDDEELTESKIRAFLDEKASELTKLQSPLYEEFYTLNATGSSGVGIYDETNSIRLPPKSRSSPSRAVTGTSTSPLDAANATSPVSCSRRVSNTGSVLSSNVREVPSPQLKEATAYILEDAQQEPSSPSVSCSERERKWKEELDQELERKREMKRLEMMRQPGVVGKTSSPKDRAFNKRDRLRFASPGK